MNIVGTNTSDVILEPNGDRLRASTIGANAHTSIPIVDILLPSGHEDHVKIPHANLSITGYEPDSLRTLVGMGTPSMRTQEISAIPQLDGLGSLPIRDHIGRRVPEVLGQQNENPLKEVHMYGRLLCQEGENIQEETVMIMALEGCTEIGDPLREGDIQTKVEDPLTKRIPW